MSKLSIVALAVGVLSCVGAVYAAVSVRQASSELRDLETKVSAQPEAGAPSAAGTKALTDELEKLRAQVTKLEEALANQPVSGGSGGLTRGQVDACIEDWYVRKDREAKGKEIDKSATRLQAASDTYMKQMTNALALTEVQQLEIRGLLDQVVTGAREGWTAEGKVNPTNEKVIEMRKSKEAEIRAKLTPEQQAKFDKMNTNWHDGVLGPASGLGQPGVR